MGIGQRLRELREQAGLSQTELAKAVAVSRNAVSQWESDVTQPSTRHLAEVARVLNVSVDRIMAPNSRMREKVVEAAFRLFDRVGFEETTIEIICASADVSKADFAALFENKHELLYEVLKTYNDRTFAEMQRLPPKFGTLDARLKHLLRLYYVNDLAHIKLTAALLAYSWQWGSARERDNARQLSDHHDMVLTVLEEAAAQGEIAHGNFRAASSLIFAAYTMSLRKAIFENYDADKLITYVQPQLDIILNGLTRPPEG
ncbi:MAG: helix-turn-helix domain-containing protein [Hyphomicrobiaceae bacterium]